MRIAIVTLLSGCMVWQRVPPRDVHDEDDVLVLTDDHAYELTDASVRDHKIVGHPERLWKLTPCSVAPTHESPGDLASVCRWPIETSRGGTLQIDVNYVTSVRAQRLEGRRTAKAVVGGVLLGGLVATVVMLVLVSRANFH